MTQPPPRTVNRGASGWHQSPVGKEGPRELTSAHLWGKSQGEYPPLRSLESALSSHCFCSFFPSGPDQHKQVLVQVLPLPGSLLGLLMSRERALLSLSTDTVSCHVQNKVLCLFVLCEHRYACVPPGQALLGGKDCTLPRRNHAWHTMPCERQRRRSSLSESLTDQKADRWALELLLTQRAVSSAPDLSWQGPV